MTKAELVTQVAQETQLTQHQSAAIVERFLQCIIEALQAGDTVELRGFGRFRCRHRRARQGRNPKTGVPVAIPAQTVPVFTVGKALHVRLNPGLTPASPLTRAPRLRPRSAGRQRRTRIPAGR